MHSYPTPGNNLSTTYSRNMEIKRCFDLLNHQQKEFAKQDSLAKKENGEWVKYSTDDFVIQAQNIALGLLELGISKDDKVAIVSWNRPEWNIVDMGIQQIGAVSVPMYPNITIEDYNYIFKDAGVKAVFVSDEELYQTVKRATLDVVGIKDIYTFDEVAEAKNWKEVQSLAEGKDPLILNEHRDKVHNDDLLTLIYTSGTTGKPKGVMLTHNNLISNVLSCYPLLPVDQTCKALSFLPLCHVYERMLTYLYMYAGVSIYYAESMETIGDNLKEVHPHIFSTVPRLLEKVYDKIYAKGLELTGIKRKLFFWALELGLKYDNRKKMGGWYNFQLNLANKIIFKKWREALGGNVRAIVSGSAALQPRLSRVFSAAQITVLEGYGLTETSPVIAVNRVDPKERMIGTVGPVIDGVEVKISESGEILSRGPHIMKGYYNKPEATAEVIDAENWFHTGDKGELVEDGGVTFLKITGRVKEIFKTSGGKYVAPTALENKYKESVVIEQIMVVGENEKFPGALIVPNFEELKKWCEHKGIEYTTNAEMVKNPKVLEKFRKESEAHNEHFSQWEKIKQFRLLPAEWTIDAGELTPTLKCKRAVITEKYKDYIEDMYRP